MEWNTTRKIYDNLFQNVYKPALHDPRRCVRSSLAEDIGRAATNYLPRGKGNKLRGLLSELEEAIYMEMKKKDERLLREINNARTESDELEKLQEEWSKISFFDYTNTSSLRTLVDRLL